MNPLDASPGRMSRSPNGCNAKPIYLALRPSERTDVEAVSKRLVYSVGGTARLLMLLGLEQYNAKGIDELFRINEQDLERHPPAP